VPLYDEIINFLYPFKPPAQEKGVSKWHQLQNINLVTALGMKGI
jgi:hypothetical protein